MATAKSIDCRESWADLARWVSTPDIFYRIHTEESDGHCSLKAAAKRITREELNAPRDI